MSKTLILMRHAEAVPSHPRGNMARPLVAEGHRQAMLAGQHLKRLGLVPDLIIASPAVRIQETIAGMMDAWGFKVDVVTDPDLFDMSHGLSPYDKPFSPIGALNDVLLQAKPQTGRLLIAGHNPAIANIVHAIGTNLPYDLTKNYPSATATALTFPWPDWSVMTPSSCPCEKVIYNGTKVIDASVPSPAGPREPTAK